MIFEFNGEEYETEVKFLEAVKKEYESGDAALAIDALETYGFDLNDLGVKEQRLDA